LKARTAITSPLESVALSPDGHWLAAGTCQSPGTDTCAAGEVLLWRLADSKLAQDLKGHTDRVSALAFSGDGAMLASGAADGSVILWRVGDDAPVRRFTHSAPIGALLFNAYGTALIAAANPVAIWRMTDGAPLGDAGLTSDVLQIGLSPDGTLLAAVTADNRLLLWKLQ
jgi:WD40 repeat protein